MRAIIDTNVLISGIFWRGPPHDVLAAVEAGRLALVTSRILLQEFQDVLFRPKFDTAIRRAKLSRAVILRKLIAIAEIVEHPPLSSPVSRDIDDDELLALCSATRPDMLVSGDDDLLILGSFEAIPIVRPLQALTLIAAIQSP